MLAVPGPILSELSVGPNTLIGLGARPVLSPRDVIDAVGGVHLVLAEPVDRRANGVLAKLPAGEARTVDELAEATGIGVTEVAHQLLRLEIAGTVERQRDGRYARTGR